MPAGLPLAERFLGGLRRRPASGKAIYGECGGYMALGETLTAADGRAHRMAGLLPLATSFAERRLHLGYREATLLAAGPLGKAGTRFRGHEFHYATTVSEGDAAPLFAVSRFLRRRSRPGRAAARFGDRLVHPPDRPRRGLTPMPDRAGNAQFPVEAHSDMAGCIQQQICSEQPFELWCKYLKLA